MTEIDIWVMKKILRKKPRTLNVYRTHKYIAKTTPDVVSRRFNFMDDDAGRMADEWKADFVRRMRVKHGSLATVIVWTDESKTVGPWEHVIMMRASPGGRA